MEDDKIERAQGALTRLAHRQDYDQRNRLALLAVHGWAGLAAGVLILTEGGPAAWDTFAGPDREYGLAVPVLLGGLLLLSGLLCRPRSLRLEAAGMVLLLGWDLFMAWLLGSAAVSDSSALYPVAVYGCLAALMGVHLRTLYAYARGEE